MSKVYTYVQEAIINRLEEAIANGGTAPWKKPWKGINFVNYVTRSKYRGINLLLLPEPGEYITFNQIKKLSEKNPDIKLKKGSKGNMVVFWSFNSSKKKTNDDGEDVLIKYAPIFKYYNVFNIRDVEGLESKFDGMENEHEPIEEAERILADYSKRENIEFRTESGSDRAFYSITGDYVSTPDKAQFKNVEEYYSTKFHEAVHSTGSQKRLKRFIEGDSHMFGSEIYSKEELVAEIGANMLMGILGIETEESVNNNVSYLYNWLSVIKKDIKLIVSASQQAQKAVDLILGESFNEITED